MAVDETVSPAQSPENANDVSAQDMTPQEVAPHYVEAQDMSAPSADIHPQEAENHTAIQVPPSSEELLAQLHDSNARLQELQEQVLRERAEQENLRRRMQRDLDNARKFAVERFAGDLLPVKDSLEMGLEAAAKPEATVETLREGSDLILKMLQSVLEKFGIQEINPQGAKFNPEQHEAMAVIPSPGAEPGTVVVVHRKGYVLNERLLRPAQVVVSQ